MSYRKAADLLRPGGYLVLIWNFSIVEDPDFPVGQAAGGQREHHLIHVGQASLPFADDLRLEGALAVAWHVHADRPDLGEDGLRELPLRRFFCDRKSCKRRTFAEQVEGPTERCHRASTSLKTWLRSIAVEARRPCG